MRLPLHLELVRARGHKVFDAPRQCNLTVVRGPGGPGEWDGIAHIAYRNDTAAGWTTYSWPCATRPGIPFLVDPMNSKGTAVIEPGQYATSHRTGLHHGRPALVQVKPVTVRRDADRDSVLEPGALDVGLFGVNVHDVASPSGLAGCIGLSPAHMADLLDVFGDLDGPSVSLTVVLG